MIFTTHVAPTAPLRRILWLGLLLSACLFCGALFGDGSEVVVLYNQRLKESAAVAFHYAEKRSIPTNQIIGFEFENWDSISRDGYNKFVEDFLIKELERRGLAKFRREIVPATMERPGRVRYQLTAASVRYLVPTFGVPIRVSDSANWVEDGSSQIPAAVKHNGACFDNELALLPVHGSYPLNGPQRNPRFSSTNAAFLNPKNGVFMVSRLDGPTPELAKGLVDKALMAEQEGLWGRAYFDLRNITNGAYASGDRWITNCSTVARDVGYETIVDNRPGVFNNAFPMSQIALYFGWYEGTVTGPFTLSSVEFAPGALAYHLHSYSARNIRSSEQNWVGPLLAKGVTFTMGCTDEPYLTFTPKVDVFLECLLKAGFTAGEAALNCQPALSWHTVVVGDPLYRPGANSPINWADELARRGSSLQDWAELRKVNLHLRLGRDPVILREYLTQLPFAAQSAVICEKIADLSLDQGNYPLAIEWAGKAIKAGGSPQQRVRLLRNLADWQQTYDQSGDSLNTLSQFALEFPGHPDLLPVRRAQLKLAHHLDRPEQAKFFNAEVERLSPPPTNSVPATNTSPSGAKATKKTK
jgi:uncharacterized protein (TIGR03790 family)